MRERSTWAPTRVVVAALALACLLAARLALGRGTAGLLLDTLLALVAAGFLAEAATRARRGRSRLGWHLQIAGVLLWLVAPLAWLTPLPDGVATVGRLGLAACFGAGWWFTSLGADHWSRVRLATDSGLTAGTALIVAWQWPLRLVAEQQGAGIAGALAVAVPLATVAAAALATGLAATEMQPSRRRMPALVIAAMVTMAASDVSQGLGGAPFWAVAFALLVLATRVYGGTSTRLEVFSTGRTLVHAPYALLAPAALVLGAQQLSGGIPTVSVAASVAMVVLLLVRQHVIVAENRGLVTRLAASEQALRHKATHDALTGLAGRVVLYDLLDAAVERRRRDGTPVAVCFIDLDDFKLVNDTLGHAAGDDVLVQAARRISEVLTAFGDDARAVRMSGDEFAALLPGPAALRADECAEALVERIRQPMQVNGREVVVGASAGVAVAGDEVGGASELLRASDVAMYEVKRRRKAVSGRSIPPVHDHGPLTREAQL